MTPTITEIFIQFITSRTQMTVAWIILSAIAVAIWCIHSWCFHSRPVWKSILTGSWIPMSAAAYILMLYGLEANAVHKRLVDPSTEIIRATLSENQLTVFIGTRGKTVSVEKEILGSQVSTTIITPENSIKLSPDIIEWLESKQVKIAGEPISKSIVNLLAKNP